MISWQSVPSPRLQINAPSLLVTLVTLLVAGHFESPATHPHIHFDFRIKNRIGRQDIRMCLLARTRLRYRAKLKQIRRHATVQEGDGPGDDGDAWNHSILLPILEHIQSTHLTSPFARPPSHFTQTYIPTYTSQVLPICVTTSARQAQFSQLRPPYTLGFWGLNRRILRCLS